MSFSVIWTTQFKRDYKKASKRNLPIELLDDIIRKLAEGEKLPEKNRDSWGFILIFGLSLLDKAVEKVQTCGYQCPCS